MPSSISWRVFHPFVWSGWSQLLWERHLVLLSVAAPILKSKHILPYTGRQKSTIACSDEWIMRCVSSFALWCRVRCNQSANWVGQGFMSSKALPCGSKSLASFQLLVQYCVCPQQLADRGVFCMCSDPNLSCLVWTRLKSENRLVDLQQTLICHQAILIVKFTHAVQD